MSKVLLPIEYRDRKDGKLVQNLVVVDERFYINLKNLFRHVETLQRISLSMFGEKMYLVV